MRNILSLIVVFFLLQSCSNDIEFNTPALQGSKNYNYWRARDIQAILLENGGIRIIGFNKNEMLILKIEGTEERSYGLGSSSINSAAFEDSNLKSYTTGNNGDGEIILEEYDTVDLTISGRFKFNSNSEGGGTVNFIDGIFYKIPIENIPGESNLDLSNIFNASINSTSTEIQDVETNLGDNEVYINAKYANNSSIEFYLPKNISLGAHNLNYNSDTYANYIFADGTISPSQYGTLTVLEHDIQFRKIKASFTFNTGFPYNLSVTNGNFIIYY